MTEALNLDHLRQWIGRGTEASDIVTAQLVKGLRATLFQDIGEPKAGDAAPAGAFVSARRPPGEGVGAVTRALPGWRGELSRL